MYGSIGPAQLQFAHKTQLNMQTAIAISCILINYWTPVRHTAATSSDTLLPPGHLSSSIRPDPLLAKIHARSRLPPTIATSISKLELSQYNLHLE